MYYERFIARRYLRSGRFFTSLSSWITMMGVALGVAVVCFVMSMHNGFESELRERLLGTTSHISIFSSNGDFIYNQQEIIETVEAMDNVIAASPFIYYKAAISTQDIGDGIVVRGIDPTLESRTAQIEDNIILGQYRFDLWFLDSVENASGIIIGESLAGRLQLDIGDPLLMYSLRGEDLRGTTRPRVAKFYVTGIFETGLYEFDAEMAYISLEAAQDLFRMQEAVTGVHLKLTDIYLAGEIAPQIENELGFLYNAIPWNELHKNLFAWLAIEKKVLFIGFILIVLVAAFSIISTLVMLAMEKRSDIGILKTVGATAASIKKIFLFNGLIIGLVGILVGWSIAILAAIIQNQYALISLPGDLYFIDYLPIKINPVDFLLAGALTIAICLLAAWYPARKASGHSVVSVLRQ